MHGKQYQRKRYLRVGDCREYLNMHSFKQKKGVYYNKNNIVILATNKVIIRVVIVLILVLKYYIGIVDTKDTFLSREFRQKDKNI